MRHDKFGNPQPEEGDDLTAAFEESHGNNDGLEAEREAFENTEWLGGWNVEVRNEDGDGLTVVGFVSKEALESYLTQHGVDIT